MKKNNLSVGQIIRKIQKGDIQPAYALCGNELFLQDFFIDVLKQNFLEQSTQSTIYSLGDDNEEKFLSELSSISLFDEKKLVVVRQIQKLSKKGREELIEYMISSNNSLCIVLIFENYDPKSSTQKYLESNFIVIDVRVPFNNKIKEWINYIVKQRNYKIENGTIEQLISIYGDSISHMVNEIDKLALMGKEDGSIEIDNIQALDADREFPIWELQNSLGKRDLKKSLMISHSLIHSGVSLTQIIINLSNLFMQLLWSEMGKSEVSGYTYTGLNKIITNNLTQYSRLFSFSEVSNILLNLEKTDMIIKTTSINDIILNDILIYSICGVANE